MPHSLLNEVRSQRTEGIFKLVVTRMFRCNRSRQRKSYNKNSLDTAIYFEEKQLREMEGKAPAAYKFVRSTRNDAKQKGRQRTALLRSKVDRAINGSVLHLTYIDALIQISKHKLILIMKSFREFCNS